jgi:hypothetical protein
MRPEAMLASKRGLVPSRSTRSTGSSALSSTAAAWGTSDAPYCYVFGVREGLLTEVIEYCDTALVERVLELPANAGG